VIAPAFEGEKSASTAPVETGAADVAAGSGSTRRMVLAGVRPELHARSDPWIALLKRG
jgi:hypothetical protein